MSDRVSNYLLTINNINVSIFRLREVFTSLPCFMTDIEPARSFYGETLSRGMKRLDELKESVNDMYNIMYELIDEKKYLIELLVKIAPDVKKIVE